ncbi:GNAT family N-acetyltransferase [Bacillus lacus]|uniref:GNAT family N-acetyltransferase n=1 Tax=Metabacillus lacus TaxID=1983721 RepID=A0A7X2IW76_9BACI|nr:GNAT family protein [Metabacillus lacus]MRX70936.1 GNAT family N-acetyltransferase [Metabacillus lacus]
MSAVFQEVKRYTAKNGEPVILRPVQLKDAADVIQSARDIITSGKYIQKERPRTLQEEENFIRQARQFDHMYTGVEINGAVAGIARVLRGDLKMKQHTGMFRTWLDQPAQGKGIGKELMYYTLDWCRTHGLHKLSLTVFASNEIAYQLYKKTGFIEEGIFKNQVKIDGNFDDEIYMSYFFKSNQKKPDGNLS